MGNRIQGREREKRSVAVRSLINKIIIYSAMKIIAKEPALYSMLNPETSSDSPSAKSKGVRLVSAKIVINQRGARGSVRRNFGDREELSIEDRSKDKSRRSGLSIIRAILTS